MRSAKPLLCLSTVLAAGLLLGPRLAPVALAQNADQTAAPAPAPAPAPSPAEAAAPVNPPERVGRVASLNGTVSFRTLEDSTWNYATLNFPVTTGNAFWTEPKANAALELGETRIVLDQQTETDIDTLNETTLAATEPQGAIYLHLRDAPPDHVNTVTTPRGVVTITAAGRYEIVAGDAQEATRVLVIDGGADIAVGDLTLHVGPHQAAAITGSDQDSFKGSVGAAVEDAFITAQLAQETAPPPAQVQTTAAYTPPPLVQHMTGYEALATVGTWQDTPQYGHVWFPPVAAGYVPYRNGHWAYVAPWGWTWIDAAPWGFAPFHYGRWAAFGGRWGWVPYDPGVHINVATAVPVYAPALVSFIGIGVGGGGVSVGVNLGGVGLGASVGWVPLAPGEPYIPPFRASPTYIRNVNVAHVTNVTNITNINRTTVINNYRNVQAATVVPAQAMVASQPVAQAARPVTPQVLAAAKPFEQVPVRPTAATAGVTPAVAQQLHLPPAPAAKPGTAAAPGKPGAPPVAHAVAPGPKIAPMPAAAATAKPAIPPVPKTAPANVAPAKPAAVAPAAAKPAVPGEAKGPEPTKPGVAPPKPAAEGAKPVEPAKPAAEGAKPAEPAKPAAEGAKPAEPAKPAAEGAKPAEPAKPAAEGAKPSEPAKPAAAAAPHRPLPPLAKPNSAAASHLAPHAPAAAAAKPAEKPAPGPKPAATAEKPAPGPHPVQHPAAAHPPAPKPATAQKPEPKKCPDNKETC